MKDALRPLRWASQIVGAVVLALALLATFGVGDFRMCYGKKGECRLLSEAASK